MHFLFPAGGGVLQGDFDDGSSRSNRQGDEDRSSRKGSSHRSRDEYRHSREKSRHKDRPHSKRGHRYVATLKLTIKL